MDLGESPFPRPFPWVLLSTMGGKSALVALIVLAGLATASRARAADACKLLELGELPVHMDGLKPMVDVQINGMPVRLIADSGAFFSTLGEGEARRLKLRTFVGREMLVKGVNGYVNAQVEAAQDFTILRHTFKDVEFVVAPNYYSTRAAGLLGQNILNAWETEFDLANGSIRLWRERDCGNANLAYWAKDLPLSFIHVDPTQDHDHEIRGRVSINGVDVSAIFDTGASRSVLSLRGAARVGIKRDDPALLPNGTSGGVGRRQVQSWIAPVQSFKIGDEEIKNTRLRVGEIEIQDADMLIGADFFLSHRVLVSNAQQRLYLTYNGGPVFNLDAPEAAEPGSPAPAPSPAAPAATTTAEAPPAPGLPDQTPKDADAYVLRAQAAAARREFAEAIADYTKAAELAPRDAAILMQRGRMHLANREPELALADFDQALRLRPDDAEMRMTRGALQLRQKHMDLAKADFDAATGRERRFLVDAGALYMEAGLYPEAIAEFDAWLSDLPRGATGAAALNDRCWARALWNHDLDKALADCDAAVKLNPKNLGFRDSRGLVLARLGRFDEAIKEYDSVLREQPKAAWPLYCRGLAKRNAGHIAEGDADISAAVRIDPEVVARAKRYGLS